MDWVRIKKASADAASALSGAGKAIGEEAVKSARKIASDRPAEVRDTLKWGGGMGVVAFGGAVGLPVAAVAAVAGLVIGNRIGVEKDKKELEKRRDRNPPET